MDLDRLVHAWIANWNAHDMARAAALVAADVDFVTVAGLWLHGRDEFLRHHAAIHRAHMRATTWWPRGHAARALAPGLALAHVQWTITGELGPDDAVRPPRSGLFTWVVRDTDGGCTIAAAHNTNLRADIGHRLAGAGRVEA